MQKNKTTRTNVRTAVNLDEIEYASYNPGRVGFQEGIYIRTSELASHLTNEVWCRKAGSLTRTGFDVVIQSELVAGEIRWRARLTRSYASRESQGTDVVVETREVLNLQLDHPSKNLLRYRAEEFRLLIDTEESIARKGKYDSKLDLGDVDVEFSCRIDGLNVSNR